MAESESVTKRDQLPSGIFCCIRLATSVVKVNLDLSPPRMAVGRERLEQALIILLRREEVGVKERPTIMISPRINKFRILAAPPFKAALLFITTDLGCAAKSVNGRLKVIRQSQNKVNRPIRNAARESLPPIGGQDSRDIGNLAKQAHPLVPFAWPMLFICFVSSLFRSRF